MIESSITSPGESENLRRSYASLASDFISRNFERMHLIRRISTVISFKLRSLTAIAKKRQKYKSLQYVSFHSVIFLDESKLCHSPPRAYVLRENASNCHPRRQALPPAPHPGKTQPGTDARPPPGTLALGPHRFPGPRCARALAAVRKAAAL